MIKSPFGNVVQPVFPKKSEDAKGRTTGIAQTECSQKSLYIKLEIDLVTLNQTEQNKMN